MQRYVNVVRDRAGEAVEGADIFVYIGDSTQLASVYDGAGNQVSQPLTTDADGYIRNSASGSDGLGFKAQGGRYRIEGEAGGLDLGPIPDVLMGDAQGFDAGNWPGGVEFFPNQTEALQNTGDGDFYQILDDDPYIATSLYQNDGGVADGPLAQFPSGEGVQQIVDNIDAAQQAADDTAADRLAVQDLRDQTEDLRDDAQQAATDTAADRTATENARDDAEQFRNQAQTAEGNAGDHEVAAGQHAANAQDSEQAAAGYADDSQQYANTAQAAQGLAVDAYNDTVAERQTVQALRNETQGFRDDAQQAAASLNLPTIGPGDAGRSLLVNPAGDGYEVGPALSGKLLGEPFPLWDHLDGVDPPDNSGAEKYIRLTAGQATGGQYNDGLLVGESVFGVAPLTNATAQIATGPLAGETVHLLNTEESFIRARETSGAQQMDQMQRIQGLVPGFNGSAFEVNVAASALQKTGANTSFHSGGGGGSVPADLEFNSAESPNARASGSTSGETRSKNVSATWYMRIE